MLNTIRDLTQFVVIVGFLDISSVVLPVSLSEHVLLKFSLCGLLVIEDVSNFKGILICVCEYLKIPVSELAKRNTTGLFVERFHRVLNKTTTLASKDRDNQQYNFTDVATVTAFD